MVRQTSLHSRHVASGARLTDFGGWDMPLHYGSQLEEHHSVRRAVGMFDVSHMTVVDIEGEAAKPYLRRLLANDVDKLKAAGKALYSCMLNESAGVLDDLIIYHNAPTGYRAVTNAATRDKDLDWMRSQAASYVLDLRVRDDLAMIAIQGPEAESSLGALLDVADRERLTALAPFSAIPIGSLYIARTGYTGEDGFEVMVANEAAGELWDRLLGSGVRPAGLAARDTLRIEAGLHLYGAEMDETVSPLACGLDWTVAWNPQGRDFIGREALAGQLERGVEQTLAGVVLAGRGVPRAHQPVYVAGRPVGSLTSGSYSPTLACGIGLARITPAAGDACEIEIRNKRLPAQRVTPPFVRHGQSHIQLNHDLHDKGPK